MFFCVLWFFCDFYLNFKKFHPSFLNCFLGTFGSKLRERLTIKKSTQMCGKVKIMQTIQKGYSKADVHWTPN